MADTKSEPILPIHKVLKLSRYPEIPGDPFALKDDLILVLFFNLACGYENMNVVSPFLCKNQSNHVT